MKKVLSALMITLIAGVFYSAPKDAEAIPAFARKFQTNCDVCHRGFPALTEHGEKFKEQGFQNKKSDGFDGGTKEKSELDDKLTIEKTVPISMRVLADIKQTPNSSTADTPDRKQRVSFEFPHEVELMAGGTLFKNVGYWAEIEWEGDTTTIGQAYFTFNNLTGDNTLNVRAGLMPINDWGNPGPVRILQKKVELGNMVIANDGWKSRNAESAIEIYGRPANGPLFYNFGISNGTQNFGGVNDNNNAKNFFGRLGLNFAGQEIGLQGYMGKNAVASTTAVPSYEENEFNRYGIDYIFNCGDAQIFGRYILGHDENPTFASSFSPVNSRGLHINANYQIGDMVQAVVQYDYTKSNYNEASRKTFITPGIIYHPIQNLRTVLEYQFDLKKRDDNNTIIQDRLNLRLDLSF